MPSKKTGLATKKELNRFKKADLIRYVKDAGLPCNTKMSKAVLVECAFKHKELRKNLSQSIPEKRKLSEKQKANLNKFRLGGSSQKDYKNEKLIKPEAKYLADLGKLEDKNVEGGSSGSRYKEIIESNKVQAKNENIRMKEHQTSTVKIADSIEDKVLGDLEKGNDDRIKIAESQSKGKRDVRFGEGETSNSMDLSIILDDKGNVDSKKVSQVRNKLLKENPNHPILQTVIILDLLSARARETGINLQPQAQAQAPAPIDVRDEAQNQNAPQPQNAPRNQGNEAEQFFF